MRKLSVSDHGSCNDSWRSQSESSIYAKELSRPPVYNPEDYAVALKKWSRSSSVSNGTQLDSGTQGANGEMSLRQFSSVSDLLNKLKIDLRLAYSSFVQEFVSDPIDGVTLLLELLRSMQINQSEHQGKSAPGAHRRALLDENSCLLCIRYCLRYQEAIRKLAISSTGLFTLTVCIMSSVSKSRILSLELLTKICDYPGTVGHSAVSEAMSTMRFRFGEPVRFRFLVGMLIGASPELLISGLRFINKFLETSPNKQIQLYIQAELQQAGFNIELMKKTLPSKEPQKESILDEIRHWFKIYVDVEAMKNTNDEKCREISLLKEKIIRLESKIRILEDEKESLSTRGNSLKERCSELEYQLNALQSCGVTGRKLSQTEGGGHSTPAEDEGISSSDQDDCDDSVKYGQHKPYRLHPDDNDTIDDLMRDFQNIIDDAQWPHIQRSLGDGSSQRKSADDLTSEALILDDESDIVPSKILPEPPRRARSLHAISTHLETNPFFEDDDKSFGRSNSSCLSQEFSITTPSSDSCRYERPSETVVAKKQEAKVNPLRRRETFHHTNGICSSSISQQRPDINKRQSSTAAKSMSSRYFSCNFFVRNDVAKAESKPVRLSRSASTKPVTNQLSGSKTTIKVNSVPHVTVSQPFALKARNNAGLYSGKHYARESTSQRLNRVTTITAEYPNRSLNALQQLNLNVPNGKIMDLPSGLY